MFKLEAMKVFGLYGLSENPGKNGLYQLVEFKDDAFKKGIEGREIDCMISVLTDDLYSLDEGSCWYEITADMCDDTTDLVEIETEDGNTLSIPKITDKVDIDEGQYRFFIIVNGDRTEYQWVVALLYGTTYLG
jgi:hypothetical protein